METAAGVTTLPTDTSVARAPPRGNGRLAVCGLVRRLTPCRNQGNKVCPQPRAQRGFAPIRVGRQWVFPDCIVVVSKLYEEPASAVPDLLFVSVIHSFSFLSLPIPHAPLCTTTFFACRP